MKIATEYTEAQAVVRVCWRTIGVRWDAPEGVPEIPIVRCIASRCMAWRWSMIDPSGKRGDDRGYCGLVPQSGSEE